MNLIKPISILAYSLFGLIALSVSILYCVCRLEKSNTLLLELYNESSGAMITVILMALVSMILLFVNNKITNRHLNSIK